MRLLPFLLLAVLPATAFAQPAQVPSTIANPPTRKVPPPRPLPAPRTGTSQEQIEADVRQFVEALNALSPGNHGYHYSIPDLISGARIGFFGFDEWVEEFCRQRGTTQYRLDKLEFENLKTDAARVKISYSLLFPDAEKAVVTETIDETFDFKRETVPWNQLEKWRLVPPRLEDLPIYPFSTKEAPAYRPLALGYVGYFASQRVGSWQQLRSEMSLNHLKKCWLGAAMLAQDYDDQYVFENEFWREALRPYVGNEAVFLVPATEIPYTFNDKLSGQNTNRIASPAQTVLFYEGENETPIFRYDGKAAICFADGHIKLVSPDEAKTLIWKP